MVVEPDLQRARLQLLGEINARVAAVAEMPLADGRRGVAVPFEQRSEVEPPRLDMQRRCRPEHFVLE